VVFRDLQTLDEDEEFLKEYYPKQELGVKLAQLGDYYRVYSHFRNIRRKFHRDVPRVF
jgi:hypothetical protein